MLVSGGVDHDLPPSNSHANAAAVRRGHAQSIQADAPLVKIRSSASNMLATANG
jgi:hypothetical protein